jgi:ATP-dependent Lon protease
MQRSRLIRYRLGRCGRLQPAQRMAAPDPIGLKYHISRARASVSSISRRSHRFGKASRSASRCFFSHARSPVGDRDPRSQEFTIQLRAIDADKSGAGLGVAVLTALCGSVLGRNSRGGTIVVGSATLGGSIELIPNAVQVAELAVEKQAQTLLMPVSARRQLNELPDELWTKVNVEFYRDLVDAVFKALEP